MKNRQYFIAGFLLLVCVFTLQAQREVSYFNNDWQFKKLDGHDQDFHSINIPHSYNVLDPFDDEPGYYRGPALYKKSLSSSSWDRDKTHFVRFNGINQVAEVKVNGELVGIHRGGYTGFTLDITSALNYVTDTIQVLVDNQHDESIPPLMGDFTFYGGIYRNVQLIHLSETHIRPDFYSSDGVFFTTTSIESDKIFFKCEVHLQNFNLSKYKIVLENASTSPSKIRQISVGYDSKTKKWKGQFALDEGQPWSIDNPQLYSFNVTVRSKETDEIIDQKIVRTGFRTIQVDLDSGFQLNEKPYKLVGVNRHQDRQGFANALSPAQHQDDMIWIHDMGANFLRTAHYPQDHMILDACDEMGIVASVEIPLDHRMKNTEAFKENSREMLREMVYQYYNHPSIAIWAYMNEMGLGKKIERDSSEMSNVAAFAKELEDIIQSLDPLRYSMLPNHGDAKIYDHFGLTQISDVIGWNLYFGWYAPDFNGFGRFIDQSFAKNPNKAIIVSEYGAGADPRITSFDPVRFDFSLNWSVQFHQAHIKAIKQRPHIIGAAVWNMFDFGSEQRIDAVPHVNNKGLMSFGRKPKPAYYLYQAHLADQRVLELGSLPASILVNRQRKIPIEIIGNTTDNQLLVDSVAYTFDLSEKYDKILVDVYPGQNAIKFNDKVHHQLSVFNKESYWNSKRVLRINFGTNYYLTPEDGTEIWYPSEETPSSFMEINGGQRYQPREAGIGSNQAIKLTEIDPVYQTRLDNPETITCHVLEGHYQVILHLSKLNDTCCPQISVQGQPIETRIDQKYTAYKFPVDVFSEGQISIEFKGQSSFINGLEIIRI